MSFSRAQQRLFGAIVHKAWLLHCEACRIDTGPRKDRAAYVAAHDAWHKSQLIALGADGTTLLNNGRDFERVMARFEKLVRRRSTSKSKAPKPEPAPAAG